MHIGLLKRTCKGCHGGNTCWPCWLQEQDVRQIFEPFGTIDYVTMQKELAGGRQSSMAFVQ